MSLVEVRATHLSLPRCLASFLLAGLVFAPSCAKPLHPGMQGSGGAAGGYPGGATGGVTSRGGIVGAGGAAGAGGVLATGGATGTGGVAECAAGRSLLTLASGRQDVWPGIAVDSANVYWTEHPSWIPRLPGEGNGQVMKAPLRGGAPTTLASDQDFPSNILADGTSVYWTTWSMGSGGELFMMGNASIMRASPDGSKTSAVLSVELYPERLPVYGEIAVDASSVYWAYEGKVDDDYVDGAVLAVSLADGSATTLASGQQRPYRVAADASSVYFVNRGPTSNDRRDISLNKVPLHGGPVTALDVGSASHVDIALDATNIYWCSQSDGTVMKLPLGAGAPVTIASGQSYPTWIAVDATSVYWSNSGDATLMKVALDGRTPETLCTGLSIDGLAIDATSIYWVSGGTSAGDYKDGTVMRLTPK